MTSPRASWTLDDWLAWLETLSPREIDLGLERVVEVLERLALARPPLVVHVAGTNGKGSCAAMLESILIEDRRRVGCYTSPHVVHYNERIRVAGRAVDHAAIVAAFRTVESRRDGLPLTYFEYGTLAALVVFDAMAADALVLEIGLGGRLDAVNAVDPDGAIITNIALEHCDWLGDNVEAIAREKAGVMRAAKPVVFGAATVPDSIVGEAGRIGADLWLCGRDFDYAADESGTGTGAGTWHWRGRDLAIDGLAPPSLRGTFQLQNAAAVLALVESLQLARLLTREHVDTAFGRLEISGRLQRVTTRREWLLDVAHNPDAARVLGESLDRIRVGSTCPGGVTAVIGVLADKDLAGIVQPLLPHVDRWIAVTAGSPRALPARDVAQLIARLADKPCLVAESIPATMEYLEARANQGELLLVTGSFFTVGPALAWLENPGNARSV